MPHTENTDADDTKAKRKAKLEMYEKLRSEGVTLLASNPIGKGTFSTVCIGYSKELRRQVAVKLVDISEKSEYVTKFLPREVELTPVLCHPNIIKVYQIAHTSSYTAMVQEYGENGDLLKLLKKKKRVDEIEGRFLFRQLLEAVRYLESKYVVHRDLKCENIFLDRYNNVKIGDFGFARVLLPDQISDTHCGSKAYVALELLRGQNYTGNAADIWSCGVILFILLTGRMPYDDRKTTEMMEQQMRHNLIFPAGVVSAEAQNLIRTMVHPRSELRATSREIIDSKWLRKCGYFMRGQVVEANSCSTASTSSLTQNGSNEETDVQVSITSSDALAEKDQKK